MLPASSRLLKMLPRRFLPDLAPFIQSAPTLVCPANTLSPAAHSAVILITAVSGGSAILCSNPLLM